ncbi:MAG: hypothetical protein OEV92_04495 [Nitrospinota bacterium]|nr:hypothetical protein [Nitrospinota bacterium]
MSKKLHSFPDRKDDSRRPLPVPVRSCCCPDDPPEGFSSISAGCPVHGIKTRGSASSADFDVVWLEGLVRGECERSRSK